MNKERRKEISTLFTDLKALIERLEEIKEAEEEYFENMPESLQGGERGDQSSTAQETLDAACNALEEAKDHLEAIE